MRQNRAFDHGYRIRIPTIVTICYQDVANTRIEEDIRVAVNRLTRYFNMNPEQWDSGKSMYNGLLQNTYQEHLSRAASANLDFELVHTRYKNLGPISGTEPSTIDWSVKKALPALYPRNALNIWVVDIPGGLLGYAQFASEGALETDGVVINRSAFGPNAAYSEFNLDATLAHEVGHWLELLHTFQDTFNYSDVTDGGYEHGIIGEKVSDTPPQSEPTVGNVYLDTRKWHTTQPRGEAQAHYAMQNNVMNYADDICMFILTKDQVYRMRQALLIYRKDIAEGSTWQYREPEPAPKPVVAAEPKPESKPIAAPGGQIMYIPSFMVEWVLGLFNSLGLDNMSKINEDYLARQRGSAD